MKYNYPWRITGSLIVVLAGLVILSGTNSTLACWRRPLLQRRCAPMIVETIVPEQQTEAVKEPPLPAVDKDMRVNVKNVAGLLKVGNFAGARKLAEAVAPMIGDFADLEHLYRPRNKDGLGWSSKPGPNPATDGLEKKIQEFAKAVPAAVAMQTDKNVESAFWIAAMAELAIAKAPKKGGPGGKIRTFWLNKAREQRDASLDLAAASALSDQKGMVKAASRINSACVSCHSKFKE